MIPPTGPATTLTPPGAGAAQRRAGIETRYGDDGGTRNLLIWGALIVLTLSALALLLLPARAPTPEPTGSVTDPAPHPDPARSDVTPDTTRADAQAALQSALRAQAELEVLRAPAWAGERWNAALSTMTRANDAFQRGRFGDAHRDWQRAEGDFMGLKAERAALAAQHRAAGQRALDDDDATAAVAAFEAALAAEAESEVARAALERARKRPDLLTALANGQEAEARGDLEAAAEAWQRARALDTDDPRAASALQRVNATLAERAFQRAMSDALSALGAGRLAAARTALGNAATLRPEDDAVRDLRQRLGDAERAAGLRALRRQAGQAVAAEDWATAVDRYQAALKIDPDAGFARDGLTRARDRQTLHAQLDHYLERPERLYGREPLGNAERLLATAVGDAETGLAAKIARLREAVAVARTPLPVRLRSDGETEVTIYHVDRLGRFARLELELTPGDYTVFGHRDGFRDVRRVIQVRPGTPLPPIGVRCTEAL